MTLKCHKRTKWVLALVLFLDFGCGIYSLMGYNYSISWNSFEICNDWLTCPVGQNL